MMSFAISKDGKLVAEAKLRGVGIYLDNFAIIEIAKEKDHRDRFLNAIKKNGTLLFSWANSYEIMGPKGNPATMVRTFLENIGQHWIPLEFNPWEILRRESAGESPVSEDFMKAFNKDRTAEVSSNNNGLIDSASFFNLSRICEWPEKDHVRDVVIKRIEALRIQTYNNYKKDPNSLDRLFPPVLYEKNKPATFVFNHLFRIYAVENKSYQFEKNDMLDLCHAVAASYGTLITLDKDWKRRFEKLPKPNNLPRVYYKPELAQLVDDFEKLVGGD